MLEVLEKEETKVKTGGGDGIGGGGGNDGGGGIGGGGGKNRRGRRDNNDSTEYEITQKAYDALLEKWGYPYPLIPLLTFELKEGEDQTLELIKFFKENLKPLFEMESEQLKDTIALIFIKLKLKLNQSLSQEKILLYNNALSALTIFAQITKNEIEHKEGTKNFSIKPLLAIRYFFPDADLVNLEIKHTLKTGYKHGLYHSFYINLYNLLNEKEGEEKAQNIISFLNNIIESKFLEENLPEFKNEVIQIKTRYEENNQDQINLKDLFNIEAENISFKYINYIFNLDQFIPQIQKDINNTTAEAFIKSIKDEALNLNNVIKSLAKDNNKHLEFLYEAMLNNYHFVLVNFGLILDNQENKLKVRPFNIIPITSNNILLGLDSTKILSIFAETLKINGTNTKNIPQIVDYYLKVLFSEFARSLHTNEDEAFEKFTKLPVTQIPYLESKIMLMRRVIEKNKEIFNDLSDFKKHPFYEITEYLKTIESKLNEYETFFKANINASNAYFADLLNDDIKEDNKRIKANKEPRAFKKTFEKIARLLYFKPFYKNIDLNSDEFTFYFESTKHIPISEILKNEDVQVYLNEIINQTRKWELKEHKVIKTDTPASTLITLHKAEILNGGIPIVDRTDPSYR